MKNLAKYFDHTNLKAVATKGDIRELCREAKIYDFASVCINSSYVEFANTLLQSTNVKVCTVVGFPLGAATTKTKSFETKQAVKNGAQEIDMVINIGALKGGYVGFIEKDIQEVVKAASGKIVKVIIECCYLTNYEKKKACELAKKAGAHFIKTSTGFGIGGATIEDVKLMKKAFGGDVKAAGGIKTLKDARAMIEAGATRLGASRTVQIIEEFKKEQKK